MSVYDTEQAGRWQAAGRAAPPDGIVPISRWGLTRRPLTSADRLSGLVIVLASMCAMIVMLSAQAHRLARWHADGPVPNFWGAQPTSWAIVAHMVIVIGATIGFRRIPAARLAFLLLAPLMLLALWSCATRASYGIEQDQLLIRSPFPWIADTDVPLATATVVARGCTVTYSKHSTYHWARFVVEWGVPGHRRQFDLGRAAGPARMDGWLAAMRDYADDALPLGDVTSTGASTCLGALAADLDPAQTAQMHALLG